MLDAAEEVKHNTGIATQGNTMSPRQQVAENLADTCMFGQLNKSYGVNVQKSAHNGKEYWGVTFAKARVLDGVIRVYSEKFIQIKWQGSECGSEVFRSEFAAKSFLIDKFVKV